VEELAAGPVVALRSDVECPDGIGTAGAEFEGVPLADVLARAGVDAEARYLCVHSGAFTAAFALESLDRRNGILAVRKNGQRLSWEDGGPVRVAVAKGACFETVKWVERITLERDASSATALSIVRARRGLA
jgi:DMSO/TMAO reductase YedYZ molybdopterin-dependent catalytic subunit